MSATLADDELLITRTFDAPRRCCSCCGATPSTSKTGWDRKASIAPKLKWISASAAPIAA